jgi:hypothetical protein
VALKPDLAFSDVQQTSSPFRNPTLQPADSRVGVVTFVFLKSQGSSANLTNVTDQMWKAVLGNNRGVPLSSSQASPPIKRVVCWRRRNDGSGTRAVYLIEPGVGVSRQINQFKIGVNGFNGVTTAGNSDDAVNLLQLWPANDQQDANNNSTLWNPIRNQNFDPNNPSSGPEFIGTTGNGGYFSGSGVTGLLTKDTSSVRILGPTGSDLATPEASRAPQLVILAVSQ